MLLAKAQLLMLKKTKNSQRRKRRKKKKKKRKLKLQKNPIFKNLRTHLVYLNNKKRRLSSRKMIGTNL
jgi:hypothetical protein